MASCLMTQTQWAHGAIITSLLRRVPAGKTSPAPMLPYRQLDHKYKEYTWSIYMKKNWMINWNRNWIFHWMRSIVLHVSCAYFSVDCSSDRSAHARTSVVVPEEGVVKHDGAVINSGHQFNYYRGTLSLQLIWRSGTLRTHLQMSYTGFISNNQDTKIMITIMEARVT